MKDSEQGADGDSVTSNGVLCGKAAIRDSIYPTSLCKTCTRVLQDCRHVDKRAEMHEGFKVVVSCIGFESFYDT